MGRLLQEEASHITSIDLVACSSSKKLATLPPDVMRRLQRALPRTTLTGGTALTTPPWEALLAFHFKDGRTLFGQLVRTDVLRLRRTARCRGEQAASDELHLDEEARFLDGWLQKQLGPSQEKEYQKPPELPPLPGN